MQSEPPELINHQIHDTLHILQYCQQMQALYTRLNQVHPEGTIIYEQVALMPMILISATLYFLF